MARSLVLNASYEPLATVVARRAVVLVLGGQGRLRPPDRSRAPRRARSRCRCRRSCACASSCTCPFRRRVAVSRRAVMARDGHRCQYCGAHADSIDHVRRAAKGGDAHVGQRRRRLPAVQRPQARPPPERHRHAATPRSRRARTASSGRSSPAAASPRTGTPTSATSVRPPPRPSPPPPVDRLAVNWAVHRAVGPAADLPRPAAAPTPWRGRCTSSRSTARRSCSGRRSPTPSSTAPPPSGRGRGRPPPQRRGRRAARARAAPCGSTSRCHGTTRCWDDDVGRAAWWLGDAWAGALAAVGFDGLAVHRGPMVRTPVVRRSCASPGSARAR